MLRTLLAADVFEPVKFAQEYGYKSTKQFCNATVEYLRTIVNQLSGQERTKKNAWMKRAGEQAIRDGLDFFPEDLELKQYFAEVALNAAAKSASINAATMVFDAVGEAGTQARKRKAECGASTPAAKRNASETTTPLVRRKELPTTVPTPLAQGASGTVSSDDDEAVGVGVALADAATRALLKQGMQRLIIRPVEDDLEVQGVSVQKTLLRVQKRIVLSSASCVNIATRSCLLLDDRYPSELEGILTETEFVSLRSQSQKDFELQSADEEYVEKTNLCKMAKATEEAASFRAKTKCSKVTGAEAEERMRVGHCVDGLANFLTTLEPSKTSEADFSRNDCKVVEGRERPDLRIYSQSGTHQRCVLRMEMKTRWAPASAGKREVARVIEGTMREFAAGVPFFHHETTPKVAASIVAWRVAYVVVVRAEGWQQSMGGLWSAALDRERTYRSSDRSSSSGVFPPAVAAHCFPDPKSAWTSGYDMDAAIFADSAS
ncbi:hypothetical protein HDU86_001326 [Geranomyces michiganensis]|nr:hypothetical protein HDU86_001326 [Geranomyces michiganensis]